jgi:hypothetical protein
MPSSRLNRFHVNWLLAGWVVCALVTGLLYLALLPIHVRTIVLEERVLLAHQAVASAITLRAFANLMLAGRYIGLLGFLGVAGLIVWRRPNDRMGLIVALMLIIFPLMFDLSGYADTWQPYPAAWWPVLDTAFDVVTGVVGPPAMFAFFFLFPSGRPEPRWQGWVGGGLSLALISLLLAIAVFPALAQAEWVWPLLTAGFVGILALALGGQVYRYARVSAPAERRQTRLVVLGLFAFVLLMAADLVGRSPLGSLGSLVVEIATLTWLPVSLGIAILRYGLWDIEVIVRRTLIYAVLTGLLALAYFGVVLLLEAVVRPLTGQTQNPLVSVLSTLVIAALFVPLRRRVQAFIDRRFYRRKYDAVRIIAAFGATLRDEMALEQVTTQLVDVAAATVQPSHVSLWLPARETPKGRSS